ncbi:N-lysine methyltransferase SMYD2-B-like [Paramacrobiotus metropolitanus]|uniref:N-lysine methyltransferase SMYD2-B-like n=1 Tax=Paramacrobiotus metropolitanus TaxID=2943436 RepID=UPI00244590C7|nr:N-lysine methyltransferase SMYD2-B-like [Paramacrobiotus metropolitanus]
MGSRGGPSLADRRSFAAGDVVMACDPFVWTLESSAYKTHCALCLRRSESLRTCSGCRVHRYCNVTCQTADWKLEHKLECAILAKMDAKTKTEVLRVMDRCGIDCNENIPSELVIKMANKVKIANCGTAIRDRHGGYPDLPSRCGP